jgi:hypothetical protein
MNGKIKIHKATGPAFNAGERWYFADGTDSYVEIISVVKYRGATGNTSSDYEVTYKTDPKNNPDATNTKDAWNFQCRYTHAADLTARV